MAKIKLNSKQSLKASSWQSKLGTRSRIVKLIDRTCGYRDAYFEWHRELNQPNNKVAIITYITRLELTKNGGLRVEETEQKKVNYIEGCIENQVVPILPEFPPVPRIKVDKSLYPKDEEKQSKKTRNFKNRQLSIPLSETEQKLLDISLKSGDRTVYSVEDLLSGREGWYSLDQNKDVFLPTPILILLKDFNCSLEECEVVALMAGVMLPQNLLFWVEQIPQMRQAPELTKFTEPVTIKSPKQSAPRFQSMPPKQQIKLTIKN